MASVPDPHLGAQVASVTDPKKRAIVSELTINALKKVVEKLTSTDFTKWFIKRMIKGSCGPKLSWRDAGSVYLREKQRQHVIFECDYLVAQYVHDNPFPPKSERFDPEPLLDMFSCEEHEKNKGEMTDKKIDAKIYIAAALEQSSKILANLLEKASSFEFSIWMQIYAKECSPQGDTTAHLFNFGMKSLDLFLDHKQMKSKIDPPDPDLAEKTVANEEHKVDENENYEPPKSGLKSDPDLAEKTVANEEYKVDGNENYEQPKSGPKSELT